MTWDTRKFFGDSLIADNPEGFDSITFAGTPDYFSVELEWGNLPDEYWENAVSYEIWGKRYTQFGQDSDYVLLDDIPANLRSYTDWLLEANKDQYYKMRAIFQSGQIGNWIGPITVTTLAYSADVYATWADAYQKASVVSMCALKPVEDANIGVGNYSTAVATLYAGQTVTIDKPTGVLEGSFMTLSILVSDKFAALSAPDGWVAFPNSPFTYSSDQYNGLKFFQWYKFAGDSEPDSYTVTLTSTYIHSFLTLVVQCYDNVNTESSLDCDDATQYNSSNTNVLDAPTIYLSTPSALIIACFMGWPSPDHTIIQPDGYTEDLDWRNADTHYARIEGCHKVWSPS
jgi:hypothetical protein